MLPRTHHNLWQPKPDELFVRPDWPRIIAHIDSLPPRDQPRKWKTAIHRWLVSLLKSLNALIETSGSRKIPYRIDASPNFFFLTHYPPDIAAELPPIAEAFRILAHETLGPEVANDPPHPHPVLLFHNLEILNEYLRPWNIPAEAIQGLFLHGPPPHIVLRSNERFRLRLTLLHELCHATLYPLPLPLWVHEGLSRYFETRLLAKANLRFSDEVRLDRNRTWREIGLDSFWSGEAFHNENVGPATLLAQRLISRLLAESRPAFTHFLLHAHTKDAGNAASLRAYKHPLLHFTRDLLGQGAWTGPTPKKTEARTKTPA